LANPKPITNNFHEANIEIHNVNKEQKRKKKFNQIRNNLRDFTPYKGNKQNLKQNTKQADIKNCNFFLVSYDRKIT